jgi:hypothetical protein
MCLKVCRIKQDWGTAQWQQDLELHGREKAGNRVAHTRENAYGPELGSGMGGAQIQWGMWACLVYLIKLGRGHLLRHATCHSSHVQYSYPKLLGGYPKGFAKFRWCNSQFQRFEGLSNPEAKGQRMMSTYFLKQSNEWAASQQSIGNKSKH